MTGEGLSAIDHEMDEEVYFPYSICHLSFVIEEKRSVNKLYLPFVIRS